MGFLAGDCGIKVWGRKLPCAYAVRYTNWIMMETIMRIYFLGMPVEMLGLRGGLGKDVPGKCASSTRFAGFHGFKTDCIRRSYIPGHSCRSHPILIWPQLL